MHQCGTHTSLTENEGLKTHMGLGLAAAAVQTCGLRNFKSAVALSPGVSSVLSHSLPTSDPVTCSTRCLMASWKQKRHPWEKETKHQSSQSIWNPLSSRLGNFRGSLGCSVPRDKAAAALTSLSMTCILLECAKSKNSGSFTPFPCQADYGLVPFVFAPQCELAGYFSSCSVWGQEGEREVCLESCKLARGKSQR